MSTDTRSTVKIVTFFLMLSAAALLLLAIAAGVAFNRHANADNVITIAPSPSTAAPAGSTSPRAWAGPVSQAAATR